MEQKDGPYYLSTEESAKLVGITKSMFNSLAAEFADWMRPIYLGRGRKKSKHWLRADVQCLAHIYSRRITTPPEKIRRDGEGG